MARSLSKVSGKSMYLNEFCSYIPHPSRRPVFTGVSEAGVCVLTAEQDEVVGAGGRRFAKPARQYRDHDAQFPASSFLLDGEATEPRTTISNTFEKEGHMRQAKYRFFLLPLFFVLACVGLYAQANSELTGVVTDQTGAVVAGAKIVLTDPATGTSKDTVSGATGLYNIPGLNPGSFNLKVTAKGFQAFATSGIVINVSSTARADIKLTVGAESETVTVEADALAVQSDSNVVSTLISSEQISEIATENRNFAALAALGLGVSSTVPDSNTPTSVAANFTISVNGLRESHNIWLIDGGESDDRGGAGGMAIMPSQDAIAEFNMLTSNYPPDYGISSGATMSLSLKSGTQKFHGTAFEFNRNTDYNANKFFNKHTADKANWNDRTVTHYNIFGFNVGGPLYIPKMYNTNKQKTFFFWNEEWRRITNPGSSNSATIDPLDIPTAGKDLAYVAPKFAPSNALTVPSVSTSSHYYKTYLQPLGLTPGQPFQNNTIPHSLFDPNFVTYLNAGILPKPNTSNDYAVADTSLPIKVRDDIVRIDHNFNSKWAILGHYIHDSVTQNYGQPELGWTWASYNTLTSNLSNPANSAAIKLTGTITPNMLLEASINYDGNTIDITPSSNTFLPSSWSVAPVVDAYKITRKIWPAITGFGNPYGTGENTATEPFHNAAQDYEPKVDISYTWGKHAFKFGGSLNHYTKNQMLYGDSQGDYSSPNLSGDGIMDLLLGLAGNYSQAQSAPMRHYVNNTPSVYVLDNWHVTPRLTLQLGARYDALPHAWERGNYVGNFNPGHYRTGVGDAPVWDSATIDATSPNLYTFNGIQSYINGVDLAGKYGIGPGLVTNDYNTFQPRVGFSEDLSGNGKTILRGGIGTFFERMQGNDIYNTAASNPFDPALSLNQVYFSTPGLNWSTGSKITADQLIFAGGMTSMAQTYKAPAVAQFSLGVQRELAPSVIWVVQYVGNLAWHQNVERPLNNMKPGGVGYITADGKSKASSGLDSRCISGSGNKYSDTYAGCSIGFQNKGGFEAYRQYPGFDTITQQENTTNGNYNGFQTGVRLQNKWGLSGEVDYTWSHEIDITSYDETTVSNPWNLKYDKGSGQLDRRQILSINYIYKLPFFNKSTGLIRTIAGGWELAGTAIDETGVTSSGNGQGPEMALNYDPVGLGGSYTNRPNQNRKVHYSKKVDNWFDHSCYIPGSTSCADTNPAWSAPTPSWDGGGNMGFGNTNKDAVVGPGRVNFTTSLYKSFAIGERAHFELRFESFNTFNHTQFNSINTTMGNGNFGQVTTTWDPRNLELGGKFVF
jgi:hypothetical protein